VFDKWRRGRDKDLMPSLRRERRGGIGEFVLIYAGRRHLDLIAINRQSSNLPSTSGSPCGTFAITCTFTANPRDANGNGLSLGLLIGHYRARIGNILAENISNFEDQANRAQIIH
jgi:hypothetical protein